MSPDIRYNRLLHTSVGRLLRGSSGYKLCCFHRINELTVVLLHERERFVFNGLQTTQPTKYSPHVDLR